MTDIAANDAWQAGQSYDQYMGRWSRMIARQFLDWIDAPQNAEWLDIGCGTGALTRTILDTCEPKSIIGIDQSADFVAYCEEQTKDARAKFKVGGAEALPVEEASVDVAASAPVLNFVPDRAKALAEMLHVVRPAGLISFYVWDYPGGGIGFIDEFWKSAATLDRSAEALDEGNRFPFCTKDGLIDLCQDAGFGDAEIAPIEVQTIFPTFEDFWQPFTLGAGPAPGYAMSLDERARADLKLNLMARLDTGSAITFPARAWAVKAVRN